MIKLSASVAAAVPSRAPTLPALFRHVVCGCLAYLLVFCGCDALQEEENAACDVRDGVLINQKIEAGRGSTHLYLLTDRASDGRPTVHVTRDGNYQGEFYLPAEIADGLSLTFTTKTRSEIGLDGQIKLVNRVVIRLETCNGWEVL